MTQSFRSLFLALIVVIAGCSSAPDELQLRQALEIHFQSQGMTFFEIIEFRKLNGFEQSDREYTADLAYQIRFTHGMREAAERMADVGRKEMGPFGGVLGSMLGGMLAMQFGSWEVGDVRDFERKLSFIKTEQGWRVKPESK